jgi:hypothetical protein
MPFLHKFMRRTTGAQALFLALTVSTKEFLQKIREQDQESKAVAQKLGCKIAPSTERPSSIEAVSDVKSRTMEAQMLIHVTHALDLALELKC